MPDRVCSWASRLISELDDADRRAESIAAGLSRAQINWQPSPGAWSVGQCLDHLRMTNEVYLPAIAAALENRERKVVGELRIGSFSRWFIRNYIAPNPGGTKARAPKKIAPVQHVEPEILDAFLRSNRATRDLIVRAAEYDVNGIRFRNPFIPLLRFTVGTGLEIVAKHEGRHLLQAERVRQSAGFPG
ncbi:MAG: hypothetical protein C5B56_13700 [Proteobacteria bacterium]|nr:MAG: hypothetical protein C5B56_13700 [Pseudomonadota bacterium]